MNERQGEGWGEGAATDPPAPAEQEQEREPVTHSLSGRMTINLEKLLREEDSDG